MPYVVRVNQTSRVRASEVLKLLRKYEEVNFKLRAMAANAKSWDPQAMSRTAEDMAPIHILGEYFEVHIDSAACIAIQALKMDEEEPYRHVSPRITCIEILEHARMVFDQGKTLTISKHIQSSDMPDMYEFQAPGVRTVTYPELELVTLLFAHQLQNHDYDTFFSGQTNLALLPV